jgi:hypothetical protein
MPLTYHRDLPTASPDPHEACESRIRFLAEQCAELAVENDAFSAALTDLLQDFANVVTHRDVLLREHGLLRLRVRREAA